LGEKVGAGNRDLFEHEGPLPHPPQDRPLKTKKKPRYESRVFDGRIIHSAEIERIHREVLAYPFGTGCSWSQDKT
jgi:hypothetical protein